MPAGAGEYLHRPTGIFIVNLQTDAPAVFFIVHYHSSFIVKIY